MLVMPFTQDEFYAAYEEWGCNCGPSALAFILQQPLDYIRDKIPDFEKKKFTSPTMMRQAIAKRNCYKRRMEVNDCARANR